MADLNNLLRRQFSHLIATRLEATAPDGILDVLALRTANKMPWVKAKWCIARVADLARQWQIKPPRNGIGDDMGSAAPSKVGNPYSAIVILSTGAIWPQ